MTQISELMYANDIKLYKKVENVEDTAAGRLKCVNCVWSERNDVPFNVKKCSYVTFTLKRNPILTSYYIGKTQPFLITGGKGPGHDSRIWTKKHVSQVMGKAKRMIGCIDIVAISRI